MKNQEQLKQLEKIAQLILDLRLSELSRAARARQETMDRLGALDVPSSDEIDPVIAARVTLQYQAWADKRRAEINLILARQTADWTLKRASAKHAFSRSEALRLLRLAGR